MTVYNHTRDYVVLCTLVSKKTDQSVMIGYGPDPLPEPEAGWALLRWLTSDLGLKVTFEQGPGGFSATAATNYHRNPPRSWGNTPEHALFAAAWKILDQGGE